MMKRLTLFLITAGLFGSALLVEWSCSRDGSFLESNPVAPKAVASYSNPFTGKDEAGYVAGVGDAETYRAYLQMYARRLAIALNDPGVRTAFGKANEVNLAKALNSQTRILALMADGFVRDMGNAGLAGKLKNTVSIYDDGKAFLSASEALFGLEVSLIDPADTYKGTTPIPVFHTPVLDEKDTQYWEGFDPEGKSIQETFSMDGFKRTDPFSYIHYDDEFFHKEENRPTTAMAPPSPKVRPTFFAGLDPLALLIRPAWANSGHSDCYQEESVYLSRFLFTDDHEAVGAPDMEIKTTASYRRLPNGTKIPEATYDYIKADEVNTAYPKVGQKFPEIFKHSGYGCVGEVFPAGSSQHDREDQLKIQVIETDFGWDFDDKVGQWNYVSTFNRNGFGDLDADSPEAYSSPQDAEVRFFHNYPGRIIYRE